MFDSVPLYLLHDMYQLPGPAIEAILKEWNPQEYHPLKTDIREWNRRLESLCETYGIPDTQRPQCATRFIEGGFRTELEIVLGDARTKFGHVRWPQFTEFMIAFDRKRDSVANELLLMTGRLQITFRRHGRVSAPFLIILWSSLMHSSKQTSRSTKSNKYS